MTTLAIRRISCLSTRRSHRGSANALETRSLAPRPQLIRRPYAAQAQAMRPSPYGQPTAFSHPHIFQKGELTPGISATEYELRRTKLMHSLPDNSYVILLGARTKYMSNKIFYRFHQNTDFYYLTGFCEPDSIVVLEKDTTPKGYKMSMFLRPKDKDLELWEGARTGLQGAIDLFGADEAFSIQELGSRLRHMVSHTDKIYADLSSQKSSAKRSLFDVFSSSKSPDIFESDGNFQALASLLKKQSVKRLSPLIQAQRLVKSTSEAAVMRQAGEISSLAFIETMRYAGPGISEQALCSKFDFECAARGAQMLAYVPVVAGGPNALSIHYTANDHLLQNEDLVLMDAGCEYNGYASDITRTFPVNGKFTGPQRELYQAVLNVEKACIKMCTETQGVTLNDLHNKSVQLMAHELQSLDFKLSSRELDQLYPHHVGHYLGLDVHDTADIDRFRKLTSGMAITIEPGIYIPQDCPEGVPERFRGIGIRIEDDVLVCENDNIILSVTAPKEVIDIESVAQDAVRT